mgnify:CR=1 FL=1
MKFFEKTAKFFGYVNVKEANNTVKITGIDGYIMDKYIKNIWQSKILNKMMFTTITDTSMSLSSFFIPDFVYMLTVLRHDPKTGWSGKRTIDKILQGIVTNTWYKMTIGQVDPMVDPTRLKLLKWPPLPKQREFLDVYGDTLPRYGLRALILASVPGSGKTYTSLLIAACVIPPSIAEIKIIISPKKALHQVWEKSVVNLFKKPPTFWVSDSGLKMPLEKCEYYVFNYEKLNDAIELGKQLISRNKRYFVIVDESHNFADPRSERTKKLVELQNLKNNIYALWMSGSPILKRGSELVSFLKCSDPRFDAEAERRFTRIFSSSPAKAGEIFYHRLGLLMAFIVGKADVSDSKPTIKELPVKLPASLANRFLMSTVREEMKAFIKERLVYHSGKLKEYRALIERMFRIHEHTLTTRNEKREFEAYKMNVKILSRNPDLMMSEVMAEARQYERRKLLPTLPPIERKEFRKALSAIKNIKLKVRGEALGTILSRRRSECAAALGIYCKPELIMKESLSKTLFFASSILPIKALENHLKKKGFHPLLVYGSTNKDLDKIIDEFDNNPDANPICATMQSLSEAVPVTAASTVVLLNRPFRQAVWSQVIARADRLGQKFPVTVIEVTLDTGGVPNVSSTTDDILATIREDINLLMGSDFAGPDPDEREYKALTDSSREPNDLLRTDELLGLI